VTSFLFYNQGSLVDMCVQGYKSLCAAVTICATMVNIQTDRDRQTQREREKDTQTVF